MSNADDIERLFEPIAEVVAKYARRKRMKLEKCPRGNSGWELSQPHRYGGTIYLLMLHDPTAGLGIGSVWQFPCPEMSLLYSHFRKLSTVPIVPDPVIATLKAQWKAISKVKFGYWTHMKPMKSQTEAN
ncbi:MAG TPA: hypothetical protein VMJ32_09970 [Pirellulales bacterium]|nr:hypothetical protein [Pirellulales bacterium]